MSWQERNTAWLKLYHQTLWKVSKTINYQGINGRVSNVKHDKAEDLIKKLIIFPFSQFQSFQMNMASFSLSLSLSLCFPFSSFLASSHSYTQTDTRAHLPTAGIHVPPPKWLCVCVCVCVWTFTFIVTVIYLNPSSSHLLSFFFFSFLPNREIEKLISILLRCGGESARESCSYGLVSEDMRESNTSVAGVALLFSSVAPSHALTHTSADPVLIFYGVNLHQHSLWKKPFIVADLDLPDELGPGLCPAFEYQEGRQHNGPKDRMHNNPPWSLSIPCHNKTHPRVLSHRKGLLPTLDYLTKNMNRDRRQVREFP